MRAGSRRLRVRSTVLVYGPVLAPQLSAPATFTLNRDAHLLRERPRYLRNSHTSDANDIPAILF